MAFGDSLTAGESRPAYPEVLSVLVGKTVTNDGISGSTAESGIRRAPAVIIERNGSRMLILYGINDLLFGQSPGQIAVSLGHIIHACQTRNVTPVLATYPVPIHRHAAFARDTRRLNDAIRHLAASRGIRLVDLERAFMEGGKPNPALYMEDGLHPSPRGNKVMARAFAALF
jgi:lysophospholipase L1-like esterase